MAAKKKPSKKPYKQYRAEKLVEANARRQRAFYNRKKGDGLIKVSVYIHPSRTDQLHQIAKILETPLEDSE